MKLPHFGIAVVAPGGFASDEAAFERGLARLAEFGCTVHNYYDPALKFQRFGGTDSARLAQLNAATANPDVDVVMALRGAYGISRILSEIDFEAMAASGKIFVGYSDMTAFHMGLMAKTGAQSYAGPMLCDDFTREALVPYTLENFQACLLGPTHTVHGEAAGNPVADCQGTLWGGNLSMLVHLAGTPYFPKIDRGILFIEDVNEHPYRVERMLLQLLHMGALDGQQAIVFGAVSAYKLGAFENGYDFDTMLAFLRERLPMPVLTGLPFGHVAHRCTLPFGAQARLESRTDGFTLTMSDYPTLRHGL